MGRLLWLILALLFLSGIPLAQSGGGYELAWSTVDGGGVTFSLGGPFGVGGTAGQPDAGLMSGGPYTLGGGFWGGGPVTAVEYEYDTYLPLVLR